MPLLSSVARRTKGAVEKPMADEQAQNTTPDEPQAPVDAAPAEPVKDTAPAPDTPTPQTAPSEPLPQAEATPSEPAQPVSGGTAQTTENEPIDIPPFDNSPTPLPQSPTPTRAPQARSGRDLLTKARQTIQQRKQKKLEKILEFLNTKDKITNDEVEKLLHVSDATATRYLSALKKQGAIKQVGKTGHAVSYTKI